MGILSRRSAGETFDYLLDSALPSAFVWIHPDVIRTRIVKEGEMITTYHKLPVVGILLGVRKRMYQDNVVELMHPSGMTTNIVERWCIPCEQSVITSIGDGLSVLNTGVRLGLLDDGGRAAVQSLNMLDNIMSPDAFITSKFLMKELNPVNSQDVLKLYDYYDEWVRPAYKYFDEARYFKEYFENRGEG